MRFLYFSFIWILTFGLFSSCSPESSASDHYLFIGTYTDEGSDGIYLYSFDSNDGSVDSLGATNGVTNPSYLAVSPNHKFLYVVNEVADSSEATVSAFSFDFKKERLSLLNKQSSLGGAPCYISVDKSGSTVFAANYLGGSVTMFPVESNGTLGEALVSVQHEGSSINKQRQKAPHVHCAYIGPNNNQLFVADLGTDELKAYSFDSKSRSLANKADFVFKTEPGAGPRHFTFHPKGGFAYLVNELNGSIVAFERSADSLKATQTISTPPNGYDGRVSGADIHLSPDGKFLYVSNREELNNMVIFEINQQNGLLTKVGSHSSGGIHPRNFMIDPTGNYLLVANRHTDNVVIFTRNKETGLITPTGVEIAVSQPVCLKMIPVQK